MLEARSWYDAQRVGLGEVFASAIEVIESRPHLPGRCSLVVGCSLAVAFEHIGERGLWALVSRAVPFALVLNHAGMRFVLDESRQRPARERTEWSTLVSAPHATVTPLAPSLTVLASPRASTRDPGVRGGETGVRSGEASVVASPRKDCGRIVSGGRLVTAAYHRCALARLTFRGALHQRALPRIIGTRGALRLARPLCSFTVSSSSSP